MEVACLVDRRGVQPCHFGPLPEQLAALNRSHMAVHTLMVAGAAATATSRRRATRYCSIRSPRRSARRPRSAPCSTRCGRPSASTWSRSPDAQSRSITLAGLTAPSSARRVLPPCTSLAGIAIRSRRSALRRRRAGVNGPLCRNESFTLVAVCPIPRQGRPRTGRRRRIATPGDAYVCSV